MFGKEDDPVNDEYNPNDDGSPIYVDESIGDLNYLSDLEVHNKYKYLFSLLLIDSNQDSLFLSSY